MSIFIKTMTKLPENCYACPCHDGESGYCQADEEHRYSNYRPFWCPLTETREESDPCDFCKVIYPDADTKNIAFRRGKYSDFNKDSFITMDDKRTYYINVDPGDPYELGYLSNIKFCPYCGRKLGEMED